MRMRGLGASAVALALGACASPLLVYSSGRSGNGDIYSGFPPNSRLLVGSEQPEHFPRCSPDGTRILFVRGRGAAADIIVLDRRTGVELALTRDSVPDSTPAWSPDGQLVYFTRREGRFDRIARMPAAGGVIDYVTEGQWHDTMPAVSPSGRLLVHHTYRYGRETELQLIDLASGASRRLTGPAGSDYEASFAGEDNVLFSSNREGRYYRLYRLDLVTGETRRLADTGVDAWGPRFNARSRTILFYSGTPERHRLMTVPFGGGAVRALPGDGADNSGGDWCRVQQ